MGPLSSVKLRFELAGGSLLRCEQLLFPFHSPAVAGERAACTNNAMARHQQRHAIHRAGSGHGSRCFGIAHLTRKFAVAPRFAPWNLAQRLPHPQLKNRPAQIQGSRGGTGLRSDHRLRARSRAPHLQAGTATDSRRNSAAGNSARKLASASTRRGSER